MKEKDMKNAEELIKYKELIDTVIEGLNFVNSELKNGEFDKSIEIFSEMITGINTVISGLKKRLNTRPQGMKKHKAKIDEYLEVIVSAYEQKDIDKIMVNIDTKLIPFMQEMQSYC